MNKVLLDIYFSDRQNNEFWHEDRRELQYIFLGDSIEVFDNIFYPYIERMGETKQLQAIVERLTAEQKETLLKIPEELIWLKTVEITTIDNADSNINTLELKCFERIVKSYKHPVFYELLHFISINKNYSLDKENHGFGYHFHLYEKTQRTATLLTFDRDEIPFKKGYPTYDTFDHSLYYEPHSEGSTTRTFQDINTKNATFKNNLYRICKNIVVNKINKIAFKKQSSTKSTKYVA